MLKDLVLGESSMIWELLLLKHNIPPFFLLINITKLIKDAEEKLMRIKSEEVEAHRIDNLMD